MQLPGWDSLGSVTRIHFLLEVAGIIFLGLLVVSEVLALKYSNRKDVLTAQAATATENAQRAEVTTLQEKLAATAREAHRRIEELRAQQAPRRLSEDQKRALVRSLSRFHGQRIAITCVMGDGEAKQFAEDFAEVFRAAGWSGADGVNQSVYTRDPIGLGVGLNPTSAQDHGKPKAAASALLAALVETGILTQREGFVNPQIGVDSIALVIGHKPVRNQ